jgi:hypothetical protein
MDEQISEAWRRAAADLGIRVVSPIKLMSEGGQVEWFEAHVLDFGGPNGTVVGNQDSGVDIRKRLGYYASKLFPTYRTYARQHFIDALNDWGWFGAPSKHPHGIQANPGHDCGDKVE